MEPLEYLRIVRRRWILVALAVAVGLVAGYLTAPGTEAKTPTNYRADHILGVNPAIDLRADPVNIDQIALQATASGIPQTVATRLGSADSPDALAAKIKATPASKIGTLAISATDTNPTRAVVLSDAFAQALVDTLTQQSTDRYNQRVADLNSQLTELQNQLNAFPPEVTDPRAPASIQRTQFDAVNNQYRTTLGSLQTLQAGGPPPAPLTTLQPAKAVQVKSSGFEPPKSKPKRAALLGFIGLLLGIGLALTAEKLETRIVGKRTAERAFGLPVIAEIPPLPGNRRHKHELLTETRPASPFVESYRSLRTVVLLAAMDASEQGNGNGSARHGGKVILVTSPGAGEGKTTTVAHLAALLAEAGHSVLVVSADFRRPRIHELFGADREPGLSEVLAAHSPMTLGELNLSTMVEGVKLLPSGAPVENPAPLLGAATELVRAARRLFDFVLIDTAPLLVANDASELSGASDLVLVVARSRRTSIDAAGRAAEILDRIDAPTLGVVVVAASDTPTAYSYYRYRYYGEAGEQPWWRRVFGRKTAARHAPARKAAAATPAAPAAGAPTAPGEPAANGGDDAALVSELWQGYRDRG